MIGCMFGEHKRNGAVGVEHSIYYIGALYWWYDEAGSSVPGGRTEVVLVP